MATGNPTYGTIGLLSSTITKYAKTLENQIFGQRVLLWALQTAGRIENEPGGVQIGQPLLYGRAPNVGSYADYDTFTTQPNTGITTAVFPWKQFYGLIHISGAELRMNAGNETKIFDLLKARMEQVELTMQEDINKAFFNDGSGNSGKDFYGLAALVSASNPSWGNVGGIDRSDPTNSWWTPKTKDHGAGGATNLIKNMRNVYNSATEGASKPSIAITTQTIYELYEDQLQPQIRYTNTKVGDAGFDNLMFKGIPVVYDDDADVAAGTVTEADNPIWFLNLRHLHVKKLANTWFTPSDEMARPVNQDAFYKSILCMGNLTISNVARQGVLYNVL